MGLHLPDRWLWDCWQVRDGDVHHVFYLQAPRSLVDPELRHWQPSIGHAASTDLRKWKVLPDVVAPGPPGAWDDAAVWTGSVVSHDGRWWLFYTGCSTRDDRRVQRVGVASSDDLLTWSKHRRAPVVETDGRWYERTDDRRWPHEAWRDPHVIVGDDGLLHMLLTARTREGPVGSAGVLGHAVAAAATGPWEVRPPLTSPDRFARLEVPQVCVVDGQAVLLFSTSDEPNRPEHRGPTAGMYLALAESRLGPFDLGGARRIDVAEAYGGHLAQHVDGSWYLLSAATYAQGRFVGDLADPVPLGQVWPWRDGPGPG